MVDAIKFPHRPQKGLDLLHEPWKSLKTLTMDHPKHPDPSNPIRAPYLPLAVSRKAITMLMASSIALPIVSVVLAIAFSISIQRKPWVVANFGKGYEELALERNKITTQDVERFLNLIIPNLYGSLNGAGPGLQELRGLVNETIITIQEKGLKENEKAYREGGISTFALLTGINPDTLIINREKKFVYVEALGTIMYTEANSSKKTDVQWRCLLYIVEPTDALTSDTPIGPRKGNKWGLYVQQIAEQEPGTINKDTPR